MAQRWEQAPGLGEGAGNSEASFVNRENYHYYIKPRRAPKPNSQNRKLEQTAEHTAGDKALSLGRKGVVP